jgi:hypothetical protein
MILVVQDTTEFSFRWAKRETIGAIGQVPIGLDRNGKPRIHMQCGLLMNGSLVVTREGLHPSRVGPRRRHPATMGSAAPVNR